MNILFEDKVYGKYTVEVSRENGHLRVKTKSNSKTKTEKELLNFRKLFGRWRKDQYHCFGVLSGEFWWCQNPPCFNIFYSTQNIAKTGRGLYCSVPCFQRMDSVQRRENPPKWSDAQLIKLIIKLSEEGRDIKPVLFQREFKGADKALRRRVREGKFATTAEAIEKLPVQWFLNLDDHRAAEWIIEKARQGDPELVGSLSWLLDSEVKSKVQWVFKLISKKPVAREIVIEFLEETEEGKKLKRNLGLMFDESRFF